MQKTMSLIYVPASEPLHIYVKKLFLNWELQCASSVLVVLTDINCSPQIIISENFAHVCPRLRGLKMIRFRVQGFRSVFTSQG